MDSRVVKEGNIYKQKGCEEVKLVTEDGSATLLQLLQNKVKINPKRDFLGTILDSKVKYINFQEFLDSALAVASFLENISKEREIIGICSINRVEWVLTEYGSYLANCSNCPLYTSFTPDSICHILRETEMRILFISSDKALLFLNSFLEKEIYNLKHIILIDRRDDSLVKSFERIGIMVHFMPEILNCKKVSLTRAEPKSEDIATICYTSGTSGLPKGVILTHKNFISVASVLTRNKNPDDLIILDSNSVYLSYLPLSHVLERVVFTLFISIAGRIVFFSGNPKDLQNDFTIVKPTFFVAVPRVLNIFKERIQSVIDQKNWLVRKLFDIGLKYKIWLQRFNVYKSPLFDFLIFNKIASKFGGEIKACLCGAAAINPEVIQYIQATLSFKIFQGYGQTEGLGANILQPMNCCDTSTVGIPFKGIMVKLDPLPDQPSDRGEILLKGPSITPGYFKRNDENKKAFTSDGWLRTGDIGLEKKGLFYIVGRRKEIFKTSFGEYIVPERLENLFIGGPVEDIFITTSQFSDYLLAIVFTSLKDQNDDSLLDLIKDRGNKLISEKEINRYEIPAKVIKISQPFLALGEGNLVTPTMKKRREKIREYFNIEIEKAYSSM